MGRFIHLVVSDPPVGTPDDEFNEWYEAHVQEILAVEAQIAVEDISEVHPDMAAEIHLTAYKQRIVPTVRRLLDGFRGSPKVSTDALVKVALQVAQLGLAAGAHQRLPFEELIQADRPIASGGLQKSADSLPRCSHPPRPASGACCRC